MIIPEEAKQILRKILIASEKANLPYDTRERDRVVWDGVFKNAEINENIDDFIQIWRLYAAETQNFQSVYLR